MLLAVVSKCSYTIQTTICTKSAIDVLTILSLIGIKSNWPKYFSLFKKASETPH